ncbi:hypothetical protein Klosneuvirus_2_213 [Klosneuvirus KNV1]|uniref:Uncharacterized protein n=1 Tax=Klosneuvirus KNV1 TaxID=1977640 RepID=A0A1V0SJ75_9VIRU|nr:hypothetical protein Klosneuvirus_2_213 [Klosneuvirus KNV1]
MLYFRCPTCKMVLSNKQILYEQRLENISMDNKLTQEQKDAAKRKLLDDLEIKRACCRARTMGYIRLIDLIK